MNFSKENRGLSDLPALLDLLVDALHNHLISSDDHIVDIGGTQSHQAPLLLASSLSSHSSHVVLRRLLRLIADLALFPAEFPDASVTM